VIAFQHDLRSPTATPKSWRRPRRVPRLCGVLGRSKEWTKITGKVIASKPSRFRGSGGLYGTGRQGIYVVEYAVDGETKRAKLKQVITLVGIFKMIDPGVGWKVPLLLDVRSGKVKFDVNDPKIAVPGRSQKGSDKQGAAAFKRALKDK
jgi:hypothetical protein